MNSKRGASTGVSVGGSSILLIFVLLCLTTFAVLSLVSATADKRLTDRSAVAVAEYYAADAKAEEILAGIDTALREKSGGEASFATDAHDVILNMAEDVSIEGLNVTYAVPVNGFQEIQVSLGLSYSPAGKLYEIKAWKVQNTGEWQPEGQGMNLWTGDAPVFE